MFQRDFIMRQIELLVQALIEVLHLRRKDGPEAAQRLISKTARSLLGFDLDLVDSLSMNDLLRFLEHNSVFDTGKSYIAARLLIEEASCAGEQGRTKDQQDIEKKALLLLLEPILRDTRFGRPDDHRLAAQLLSDLDETDLPALLRSRLMDYFEKQGAYARAEDILLLAREQGEQEIIRKGRDFYLRLSRIDDEQLNNGNFSRMEINDGLTLFPPGG